MTASHLRLIAQDGELLGPPPTRRRRVNVEPTLTTMRLCAAIIEREPDNGTDYSPDEIAAQYAATDRMVKAFRVLDAMLAHPSNAVSRPGHKSPRE